MNTERQLATIITAMDKELMPVAEIVQADGIQSLTDFTPEGINFRLNATFSLYDPDDIEKSEFGELDLIDDLFKEYPSAEYVFFHTLITEKEIEEPFRIWGGILSFRQTKGSEKLAKVAESATFDAKSPLTGEKAKLVNTIFNILKDFSSQNAEIKELMEAEKELTEAQIEQLFDFRNRLSQSEERLFSYVIKTENEHSPAPKPEIKTQPIRQSQPAKPENLIMPKTEIFKSVTSFSESDFNEQGRAYKELKYPVKKKPVTTELMLTMPIEDKLDSILLFPISNEIFQPVVMRAPLNTYDGKVYKAICTLIDYYINLNPSIVGKGGIIKLPLTLSDIHHAMGYKGRLKPEEAGNIRNSVFKLSTTQIYYNWSEEQKARHITFTDEVKDAWGNSLMYTQDVLYMLEAEYSNNIAPKHSPTDKNGVPIGVEGFIIKAIPPVYMHAKKTHVIASVPIAWFDVKALGKMTNRRNSLLQGLTERIATAHYFKEQGKNPNKGNYNVIVLDTFFFESGIPVNNKQTRSALIKDLEIILNEYKKRGLIKKFTYSQKASGLYSIKFYV